MDHWTTGKTSEGRRLRVERDTFDFTQDSIPYNKEYVSHEEIRPGLLATRKEMLMGARRVIEMDNIRFPADNAWSIYDMYLGSTSIKLAHNVYHPRLGCLMI